MMWPCAPRAPMVALPCAVAHIPFRTNSDKTNNKTASRRGAGSTGIGPPSSRRKAHTQIVKLSASSTTTRRELSSRKPEPWMLVCAWVV